MKNFIMSIIFLFPFYSQAQEVVYHCPNISDIEYSKWIKGNFEAKTNYSGLNVQWGSFQSFPEKEVKITEFYLAKREGCVGGSCDILCVYHNDSRINKNLFLFIRYNTIKSDSEGSGSWKDNYCFSSSPENCQFYLTK